MATRNSSAQKGRAKAKPGMMKGYDDTLVDHKNDNQVGKSFFPCPHYNQYVMPDDQSNGKL